MGYLLDTNIVISALRGNKIVRKFLEDNRLGGFFLSTISIGELYYGIHKSNNRNDEIFNVQVFVQGDEMTLVDFDVEMAETYGILTANLEKAGKDIPNLDKMLAATADSLDVPIVTLDKKHFPRLVDFGVRVKALG